MARTFGSYSPAVPLNTTWEESIILEDEKLAPVNLTGYGARIQFYADRPVRDPNTGLATVPPIAEITTAGVYPGPAPAWPVIVGATIATPANGTLATRVDVADIWLFSPTNAKRKLYWSILLVNPANANYTIPVVQGKPVFLPATTL
jgi:hypothetical protein